MDSKGNVYSPEQVDEMMKAAVGGHEQSRQTLKTLMPLELEEATQLAGMNRAQRRAFYSNNRRTRPRFGGATKT